MGLKDIAKQWVDKKKEERAQKKEEEEELKEEHAKEFANEFNCEKYGTYYDVISNNLYNADPILGIPWGILGMLAFSAMAIIALSIFKEHDAEWVQNWLTLGTVISGFGILIALYLVYLEIFKMGVFCQYCTGAHIADVAAFALFLYLSRMKESSAWTD